MNPNPKPSPPEYELVWHGPGLPFSTADLPRSGRWRPRQFVIGRYPEPEPWRGSTVLRTGER